MNEHHEPPIQVDGEGEDILFKLRDVDAQLIRDQIVVWVSEDTLNALRQYRTIKVEEFDHETQGYLDDASICFIAKRVLKTDEELIAWRDKLLSASFIQKYHSATEIKEYVDEAEHQDGYGYWNQFAYPWELYEDMVRYFGSRG